MEKQEFMSLFAESIQLKDFGALRSSLEKRKEATRSAQNDLGYYSLGKANEAILFGYHIGDGPSAYEVAKEALKNVKEFAKADSEWKSEFGFSPLRDCFGFIAQWATSYEEALQYTKQSEIWVPSPNISTLIRYLEDMQRSGTKWWKTQHAMSQNFYSRTTPEKDAGKYAAGMSILQCIISRALNEQSGYEIDENDYFDILDDILWLSFKTYDGILKKFVEALPYESILQNVDGAAEQFIVFLKPFEYWIELMPDCPKKWKSTFQAHYEMLMNSPTPIYPKMMKEIGAYFADTRIETKNCPQCGHVNAALSPICIRCNFSFKDSPNIVRKMPIWYALINLGVMTLLWGWAIKSNMKWYVVAIAVFVSILMFPQTIYSIRNKKER